MFKPFEDKEKVAAIEKERQVVLEAIKKLDIDSTERQFLLRKLAHLTQKFLDKARYGK